MIFAKADACITAFALHNPVEGIKLTRRSEWSGLRGHTAWDFSFDLGVPVSARLGAEGTGLKIALKVPEQHPDNLSAGHCGLARTAPELAMKFAQECQIDGKPLWHNQATGFSIVESQARLEVVRVLTYRGARMSEARLPHRKENFQAKFFAAEALLDAVGVCNRVLGGPRGHLDTAAERYLRDAYTWFAAHGTIEIQKLTVARETFASTC